VGVVLNINNQILKKNIEKKRGYGVLRPLSTIFQLYHLEYIDSGGNQFLFRPLM
jgi:hypothetical protein